METISAEGLRDILDQNRTVALLDVREPWEFDLCRIQGSINIPMSDIMTRVETLEKDAETVVICHHGMRSLQVAAFLDSLGFEKIINLEGGVAAWAARIDATMQQY